VAGLSALSILSSLFGYTKNIWSEVSIKELQVTARFSITLSFDSS
jgi:hypothetical protein